MSKDKAMKLALEALTVLLDEFTPARQAQLKGIEAVTALREALAEQPAQQEPVAWMWVTGGKPHYVTFGGANSNTPKHWIVLPLYTSPPAQRTWVGLTDQEIENLWNQHEPRFDYYSFSCDIEAKLKEKNT